MGLGRACCRAQGREAGIGAKYQDRDLGDLHPWPHSHYLMRQCSGVGGRGECVSQLSLVQMVRAGAKTNRLMMRENRQLSFIYLSSFSPTMLLDTGSLCNILPLRPLLPSMPSANLIPPPLRPSLPGASAALKADGRTLQLRTYPLPVRANSSSNTSPRPDPTFFFLAQQLHSLWV